MSSKQSLQHWQRKTLQVNGKRLKVWPKNVTLKKINKSGIYLVQFSDYEHYHAKLVQAILEREKDPQYGLDLFKGACGVKVHHVDRWEIPAANLIHQRAMALYSAVTAVKDPVSDMSWGNVYRNGDYCLPHSHTRAEASIVYVLSLGDKDENNPIGGRLCFADPRMSSCCQEERGRVTTAYAPPMSPGGMIIFPSELMHYVNPYTGSSPRITLSWNMSSKKIPGSANPELELKRKAIAEEKQA